MALPSHVISRCKEKLVQLRAELLNQIYSQRLRLAERENTGDEGDLSLRANDENHMFANNQRLRKKLLEVDLALARIERGVFGVCEETSEPIEVERLLALPWTRLSIEGAEIRESDSRSFQPRSS